MGVNCQSLYSSEVIWKIKQLGTWKSRGHVPQCPIAGDAKASHVKTAPTCRAKFRRLRSSSFNASFLRWISISISCNWKSHREQFNISALSTTVNQKTVTQTLLYKVYVNITSFVFFVYLGIPVYSDHAIAAYFAKNAHIAYFPTYNGIFKISNIYLCI